MLPYKPESNFAKVTPTMVGNMGAKEIPAIITAIIPTAGLLANIIRATETMASIVAEMITFVPMAVRFFIEEVRNLPIIIATPNRLNTNLPWPLHQSRWYC
jgi:hypothetical protein